MICCLVRDPASEARAALLPEIARACSPRVEVHGDRVVVFDASGLSRVIGTPLEIGREVLALAAGQGLTVRVALAPTRVGAWLLPRVARRRPAPGPARAAPAAAHSRRARRRR